MKKHKKIILALTAFMTAALFSSACTSGNNETGYPIIGSVREDKIPSEPNLYDETVSINEKSEELKASIPIFWFTGAAGELLSVESAINVWNIFSPPLNPDKSFGLQFDHAYFTYTKPFYQRDIFTAESLYDQNLSLDTPEMLDKYNLYLKNKAVTYTVNRGDKLENGLICTGALTLYIYSEDKTPMISYSKAVFSGELTLTGTVRCLTEDAPYYEKGSVIFTADSDNGKVPCEYNPVTYKVELGTTPFFNERFSLGNVSDLPLHKAELIKNNEYTDVEVTIKNIRLYHGNNGIPSSSTAEITDIKVI